MAEVTVGWCWFVYIDDGYAVAIVQESDIDDFIKDNRGNIKSMQKIPIVENREEAILCLST